MSKELKFNFNPFKEGLNHVLGTLEKDIMEVLWKREESSVKDILDAFPANKNISYSAVITVTNRMTKKGLLKKRKMGKAYLYKPIYDRERFFEIISKKVVEGISGFSLKSAMVHFVDYMSQMDPGKMEYLSKLIESKRQKQLIQKAPSENTEKR
ncbi:MAG: BlaI/MecI/CopY family transcriptional regulator [Candidatus Brocadia sp.]|nr:MAG: BlaI/MecI/CopY family transcriptional regulator [Candidatus Brocadia sp.]